MSSVTNPNAYLNQRISLISKQNIRYEGFLYASDPRAQTVSLAQVSCHGTEDREATPFVAPSSDVFQYIIFPAQDIQEIIPAQQPKTSQVIMGPKQSSGAPQFGQPNFGLPGFQPGLPGGLPGMPPFGFNNYPSYPQWGGNSFFPAGPNTPPSPTPSTAGDSKKPEDLFQNLSFEGLGGISNSGIPGMGLGNFDKAFDNVTKPAVQNAAPANKNSEQKVDADKKTDRPQDAPKQNTGSETYQVKNVVQNPPRGPNPRSQGQPRMQQHPVRDTNQSWKKQPTAPTPPPVQVEEQPFYQRPKDHTSFFGRGGGGGGRGQGQKKPAAPRSNMPVQSPQQPVAQPPQFQAAPSGGAPKPSRGGQGGRGRRGGHRGGRGDGRVRGISALEGDLPIGTEFDMEASTAAFDKEKFYEELRGHSSTPTSEPTETTGEATPSPAAVDVKPVETSTSYEKSGFFDNLSTERDENKESRKKEFAKSKKIDEETFGVVDHGNRRRHHPKPAAAAGGAAPPDSPNPSARDPSKPQNRSGGKRGGGGRGRGKPNYREKGPDTRSATPPAAPSGSESDKQGK